MREKRAKIIAAEGELLASQMRYLQTLTEIAVAKSSTIVIPPPVEIVKVLTDRAQGLSEPDSPILHSGTARAGVCWQNQHRGDPMQFGRWDVQIIDGGGFALDGGAMFGTVPKVVWSKTYPSDAENRILMTTNCLLIRGEVDGRRQVVLVDNGNGDKEDDGWRERFAMGQRGSLERGLAAHGVMPGEVTLCILTHLHFDHAGGSTRLDAEGKACPSFPNARHVVQRQDLEDAKKPHLRVRASYLPVNWEPLEAAGLLDTVDGSVELLPGISVRLAPGHIKGLQNVVVEGGGKKLVYFADLIPTARHIQPAWVMGYDLDVVTCVDERLKVLQEVSGTGTICVFEHDPDIPAGTVDRDAKGRYVVTPVTL